MRGPHQATLVFSSVRQFLRLEAWSGSYFVPILYHQAPPGRKRPCANAHSLLPRFWAHRLGNLIILGLTHCIYVVQPPLTLQQLQHLMRSNTRRASHPALHPARRAIRAHPHERRALYVSSHCREDVVNAVFFFARKMKKHAVLVTTLHGTARPLT